MAELLNYFQLFWPWGLLAGFFVGLMFVAGAFILSIENGNSRKER